MWRLIAVICVCCLWLMLVNFHKFSLRLYFIISSSALKTVWFFACWHFFFRHLEIGVLSFYLECLFSVFLFGEPILSCSIKTERKRLEMSLCHIFWPFVHTPFKRQTQWTLWALYGNHLLWAWQNYTWAQTFYRVSLV